MTDKTLAAFAAARRTGSFSTAAWELSMTQQSVSYNMKKLEQELGFPLFVRRASRVETTFGGEQLAAWYAALDAGAAELSARFPGSVPVGSVSDHQVKCFLTAARLGGLAAAAEALLYTPRNLSDIIASLERALGVPLHERGEDFTLTEAGAAYRNFFEEASASLVAVRRYAAKEHAARAATALIGVSDWLEPAALEAALADFDGDFELAAMPNTELLDCLERGEADAAIWSEGHAPTNRGFDVTPLGREELCLFTPEDGRACPLLVCPGWARSFLENRAVTAQEMSFGAFRPTGVVLAESVEELMEKLSQGGYAAVGDRRFGRFGAIGGLRVRPVETATHIVACRLSNVDGDCAARLIDHLREAL